MKIPMYRFVLFLGGFVFVSWPTLAVADSPLGAARADDALVRFVQTVVDANPRVRAASAGLEASDARRNAASRPLYNPNVSAGAENAEVNTYTLGISQSLDWNDKRSARTAIAESNRLVVEAKYLAARWAVAVELLEGLSQHQTGLARDELAEARQRLMNEFATVAKRRFDAGDLNQVEVYLASLAYTDARIQKATAAAALAEARQAIRSLSPHSTPSEWPLLPTQMPTLPDSAARPQSLALALPEVLAARRQVDVADATVNLRRREQRPDPTVNMEGGKEGGDLLIGLNVTIPLFVRNRFNNEVNAAIAERSQLENASDNVLQRAHARLVSAAERYELARGAWGDWELTGQKSLEGQSDQLRKLWQAGELSTTEYLVQLRQTLDVQESALDLQQVLWRAWFEWLWASGQVDAWLGLGATR